MTNETETVENKLRDAIKNNIHVNFHTGIVDL